MVVRILKHLRRGILFYIRRLTFGSFQKGSDIISPLRIDGSKSIFIGRNVNIQSFTWLGAVPLCGGSSHLEIGDGCIIGNLNRIYAIKKIKIGKNVLTADKVFITDCTHVYNDVTKPIMLQGVSYIGEVEIGDGSWIGENVCVFGAKIGKNCVVGANSVVKNDIPDYSVAAGSPSRVIKQYNFKTKLWERIHHVIA